MGKEGFFYIIICSYAATPTADKSYMSNGRVKSDPRVGRDVGFRDIQANMSADICRIVLARDGPSSVLVLACVPRPLLSLLFKLFSCIFPG